MRDRRPPRKSGWEAVGSYIQRHPAFENPVLDLDTPAARASELAGSSPVAVQSSIMALLEILEAPLHCQPRGQMAPGRA